MRSKNNIGTLRVLILYYINYAIIDINSSKSLNFKFFNIIDNKTFTYIISILRNILFFFKIQTYK